MKSDKSDGETRRDFINSVTGSLAALGIAGSLQRSGMTFGGEPRNVLAVVKIEEHQELQKPGGYILVKKTAAGDVVVIRSGDTEYSALSSVCPHMQCNIKVKSASLIQCPCHQSGYKTDGTYISGPAKTGLRKFPVQVQAGVITVMEA